MAFPKIEGYVVTEKLGSGSYSTVYKAYTKVGTRSVVAVKCVDKSRVRHSSAAVDSLVTEIRLLKTLVHPHIVTMNNFTWDDRNIYIIMEFCNGGDLSKYIKRYGRVPEAQVLYFLQQLASALQFLRQKGVAHMDLKPHNLLLQKDADGKYTLKVADFGLAQHLVAESAGVRGSPLYMAPEVLLDAKYDARADLWSVGVIMYECLFGRAPFSGSTLQELVDKMMKKTPIELPPGAGVSSGCRELLSRLLTHDPDSRITHDQFFQHEYLDLEHMPSKENYEKAVSLISRAISEESSGELRQALSSYTSALRYLVPAVRAEPRAPRRHALRAKLERYMERAEEIKQYLEDPDAVTKTAVVSSSVTTPSVMTGVISGRNIACCSNSGVVSSGHYYELAKKDTNKNPAENYASNQSCDCTTSTQNKDRIPQNSINNASEKHKHSSQYISTSKHIISPSQDNMSPSQDIICPSQDIISPSQDIIRPSQDIISTSQEDKSRCQEVKNSNDVKNSKDDTVKDSCRVAAKDGGSLKRRFTFFRRTTVPQLTAQDSSIVTADEATDQKCVEDTNDGCRIT